MDTNAPRLSINMTKNIVINLWEQVRDFLFPNIQEFTNNQCGYPPFPPIPFAPLSSVVHFGVRSRSLSYVLIGYLLNIDFFFTKFTTRTRGRNCIKGNARTKSLTTPKTNLKGKLFWNFQKSFPLLNPPFLTFTFWTRETALIGRCVYCLFLPFLPFSSSSPPVFPVSRTGVNGLGGNGVLWSCSQRHILGHGNKPLHIQNWYWKANIQCKPFSRKLFTNGNNPCVSR